MWTHPPLQAEHRALNFDLQCQLHLEQKYQTTSMSILSFDHAPNKYLLGNACRVPGIGLGAGDTVVLEARRRRGFPMWNTVSSSYVSEYDFAWASAICCKWSLEKLPSWKELWIKGPLGQGHCITDDSTNIFLPVFVLYSFTLEVALWGLKRTSVSTLVLELRL